MIPVNTPLFNGNEKKYLNECIDTGWISSEGPFVERFEKELAAKTGRKYGIAVCNGSVALDCAVFALSLPQGSEIIMPAFTIISCAAAIIRAGCVPVLVDSDPGTFNINVNLIEEKITPKTKAIMVVHIYGLPVDMNTVFELAKKYDLKIIEDAAEQHGQYYYNTPVGKLGDISTFSFYPNKHITTGEGGMILTDDESLAERCRSLRNLCFVPEQRFLHYELGFNYRMSNIQAAIGVAQLEQLDAIVERKRAIGRRYNELLKSTSGLELPITHKEYAENIYWVYTVVLKDEVSFNAQHAMKKLGAHGIGTRPFFYPMHLQPVFKKMRLFKGEHYPVAEKIAERGFYLPSGLGLKEGEQETVAQKIRSILND